MKWEQCRRDEKKWGYPNMVKDVTTCGFWTREFLRPRMTLRTRAVSCNNYKWHTLLQFPFFLLFVKSHPCQVFEGKGRVRHSRRHWSFFHLPPSFIRISSTRDGKNQLICQIRVFISCTTHTKLSLSFFHFLWYARILSVCSSCVRLLACWWFLKDSRCGLVSFLEMKKAAFLYWP